MIVQKETLILASGSPRRRELLEKMGVRFTVEVSDADEHAEGSPRQMVHCLCQRKAEAVAAKHTEGLILAADTLVELDGRALGKPADDEDARRMLRALSGRTHHVFTGMCLIDAGTGERRVCAEGSEIRFRELTDGEIESYVQSGEPRDKAGAYAIQGGAVPFVARYAGSYENIIGLPTGTLRSWLIARGWQLPEV